jgi:DNA ligase-1
MREFAALYQALDETNRTTGKIKALKEYFEQAEPEDAAWTLALFTSRRPKRPVSTTKVREWAREKAGLSEWLFSECYDAVGDLAETIAIILPEGKRHSEHGLTWWIKSRLFGLRNLDEDQQREMLVDTWESLNRRERFVFNKLITGSFRVGVSRETVLKGLSQAIGVEVPVLAHRISGEWQPSAEFYRGLCSGETDDADVSRPYPFYLAYPLEESPEILGEPSEWLIEWKWDGIRAQLIRRDGKVFLWSRGEDLITERFPEINQIGDELPDGTVLDGEVLAFSKDKPLPFGELQRRIGRKTVGKKLLAEVPVTFMAYDLLEQEGGDIRDLPMAERRRRLERLSEEVDSLRISPKLSGEDWAKLAELRETSRDRLVEGFMIKRLTSRYQAGRKKGDWWKWKIAPLTVDAVLINAQRGSGRRASLYTDYTFGVWDGNELVPFAKAYSGLTDEEIRKVDRFVRQNTQEKFGPVRSVRPKLVFEIAFEGIRPSNRHKSGVAVRFPRILRWRHDKPKEEADSLDSVKSLLGPN